MCLVQAHRLFTEGILEIHHAQPPRYCKKVLSLEADGCQALEDKPRSANRSRLQIDSLPLPLEDLRLPLEDLPVHNAAPPPAEATSTPTGPSAHPDELEDQPGEDIASADGSEESGGLQWFS